MSDQQGPYGQNPPPGEDPTRISSNPPPGGQPQQWGQPGPQQGGSPQGAPQQWGQPGPQQGGPQQQWGQPGPQQGTPQQWGQPGPQQGAPQQWGQQPGQQWGQQPYAGGPMGPGPGGPQGPGGGVNPKVVIGIVVALLLVIGVVVVLVLTLGGDDKDDEKSEEKTSQGNSEGDEGDGKDDNGHEAVANAYVDALRDGDCEAARALTTVEEDCDVLVPPAGDFTFEDPVETSSDDTTAVYDVSFASTEDDRSTTVPMTLSKDGDTWLVTDFGGRGDAPQIDPPDGIDPPAGIDPPSGTDPLPGGTEPPPSAGGASPLATTDSFVAAIRANDCEAAKSLLYIPEIANCDDILSDDTEGVTFGTPVENMNSSDFAMVDVPLLQGGSEVGIMTLYLIKDGDMWLVSSYEY